MALDTNRKKSEQIRGIAKSQARLSREKGGSTRSNKDQIKLAQASLKNTMLANRESMKEAQNTDSNNPEKK